MKDSMTNEKGQEKRERKRREVEKVHLYEHEFAFLLDDHRVHQQQH